jgi:hypothetical protein
VKRRWESNGRLSVLCRPPPAARRRRQRSRAPMTMKKASKQHRSTRDRRGGRAVRSERPLLAPRCGGVAAAAAAAAAAARRLTTTDPGMAAPESLAQKDDDNVKQRQHPERRATQQSARWRQSRVSRRRQKKGMPFDDNKAEPTSQPPKGTAPKHPWTPSRAGVLSCLPPPPRFRRCCAVLWVTSRNHKHARWDGSLYRAACRPAGCETDALWDWTGGRTMDALKRPHTHLKKDPTGLIGEDDGRCRRKTDSAGAPQPTRLSSSGQGGTPRRPSARPRSRAPVRRRCDIGEGFGLARPPAALERRDTQEAAG